MTSTVRHSCALVAAALVLVSVTAGCDQRRAPGTGGGRSTDTLVFGTNGDPNTLDPADSSINDADQLNFTIYDGLLKFAPDMRIVGGLADRWNMEQDGVTWTFHLRPAVRFHDGTICDAEAVKKSLDRLLDPVAAHRNRSLVDMIASVNVIDPQTVRIVTAFPFGSFESTLAHLGLGVVSPTAAAKWGKDYGLSPAAIAGTGPFKVVEWKKDHEIVLERFDGYWGDKPKLRRVVFRQIPEVESKVAALETGDVDVIALLPPRALVTLSRNPDVVLEKQLGVNSRLITFHCAKPPFNDPRVRRAISLAIDRRAIVDSLMSGAAIVPDGPLPSVMRNYVQLGEIQYDPAKARALLREAGLPNGFKTTLMVATRFSMSVEIAEAMAAQLRQAGIDAQIDVIEFAALEPKPGKPADDQREMYMTAAGASTADADWALRSRYLSTSKINRNYYSNPEFDRAILGAMKETDPVRRLALYKRAEEIVYLEDPPGLWLFHNYVMAATRRDVKNVTISPLNLLSFERAYVSPGT